MHDIHNIDSEYKPFPPFDDWKNTSIDKRRWEKYSDRLTKVATDDYDELQRAYNLVKRIAAIETGAIEDLYDVDRGFTLTVAAQSAMWEVKLSDKGNLASSLIKSQLQAYDFVLDFATGSEPIALAWVRELHEKLCESQEFYQVQTSKGPQKQKLPTGEYKSLHNHVLTGEGTYHAYAPVDMTPAEMQRLIDEIHSETFENAHPAHQASYIHYALVCIHPFADGNGRVARALASIYTYRAESIPFLVLAMDRKEYFDTLSSADNGDFQPFVNFTVSRCLSAMELAEQSFQTAKHPSAKKSLKKLDSFYRTTGGYSYEEIDKAARQLMKSIQNEFNEQLNLIGKNPNIRSVNVNRQRKKYELSSDEHRVFIDGRGEIIEVSIQTKKPNQHILKREIFIEIPIDCGEEDDFLIKSEESLLTSRISEILPDLQELLTLRIDLFCQRVIDQLVATLVNSTKNLGGTDKF